MIEKNSMNITDTVNEHINNILPWIVCYIIYSTENFLITDFEFNFPHPWTVYLYERDNQMEFTNLDLFERVAHTGRYVFQFFFADHFVGVWRFTDGQQPEKRPNQC